MRLVASALETLGRGRGVNPLRTGMWLPDRVGILATMPAYLEDPKALGIKVITVFPGNHGTEIDAHQGVVLLFDPENGLPLCIMDASEVTAIRTAAATGVATKALAREDAVELAILGSGVQARTHLEAMLLVRPIRRTRVFSPTPAHAEAFAREGSARHGVEIQVAATAEAAVRDADIVCTVTSSREPVLRGDWLRPGTHVNAVGASIPSAREVDTAAVVRSRLFVDRLESALKEAGDFLIPKREGAIDDDHIRGEIGQILLGEIPGRESPEEITLFKSLGIAVEDLLPAHYVYHRAQEEGIGTEVELGGYRHDAP